GTVYTAKYLSLGAGDVSPGAPVATPLDPRHRLVTTKYNPARTWTAENSVGIGGSYLCIYGMEGPGECGVVGRRVPIGDRWGGRTSRGRHGDAALGGAALGGAALGEDSQPWLLRF